MNNEPTGPEVNQPEEPLSVFLDRIEANTDRAELDRLLAEIRAQNNEDSDESFGTFLDRMEDANDQARLQQLIENRNDHADLMALLDRIEANSQSEN